MAEEALRVPGLGDVAEFFTLDRSPDGIFKIIANEIVDRLGDQLIEALRRAAESINPHPPEHIAAFEKTLADLSSRLKRAVKADRFTEIFKFPDSTKVEIESIEEMRLRCIRKRLS